MKLVPRVRSSDIPVLKISNTTEAMQDILPPDSFQNSQLVPSNQTLSTGRQPAFTNSNKITRTVRPVMYCPLLSLNNRICGACNEYMKNINNGEISSTDAQNWLVKQHEKLMEGITLVRSAVVW